MAFGNAPKARILLVDDNPSNLFAMTELLEEKDRLIHSVTSGEEALDFLLKHRDTSLILMDVQMPDMDGFETVHIIRQHPKLSKVPVIFITANSKDEVEILHGFDLGGMDYIAKPVEPALLRNKVDAFIRIYQDQERLEIEANTLKEEKRDLQRRVVERSRELVNLNQTLQKELGHRRLATDAAHQAGMAELASSVIHNTGNILNSALTSSDLLHTSLEDQKLEELLSKVVGLLKEHEGELKPVFEGIPKCAKILETLEGLSERIRHRSNYLTKESSNLQDQLQSMRNIIQQHDDYARGNHIVEDIDLNKLVEEAVGIERSLLVENQVDVSLNLSDECRVRGQRTKLIQVIINLLGNSLEALQDKRDNPRAIVLRTYDDDEFGYLEVEDNGAGIHEDHLDSIFRFGFTTKTQHSGFGLHYCVLALREMGGDISFKPGVRGGAIFKLSLRKGSKSMAESLKRGFGDR